MDARARVAAITRAAKSIYEPLERNGPLWFAAHELEEVLDAGLRGVDLGGLPPRTRSKVAKEHVCTTLGFPVPIRFKKTQPRFPCLDFDTYVQQANNLQIWNEEISPSRRYVLIRVDDRGVVTRVKVITGETLALLGKTGTLTRKFQASFTPGTDLCELVTCQDTEVLRQCLSRAARLPEGARPTDPPTTDTLLPIDEVFRLLSPIIGARFIDRGRTQDRNRGGDLHHLVAKALGYNVYADSGQFPDLLQQMLEVKLQTAATIDLGLVSPDSTMPLDVAPVAGNILRHCDVRYAVFGAQTDGGNVTVTRLILSTGEHFFSRFKQFQGNVKNEKLQIPLPSGFFD